MRRRLNYAYQKASKYSDQQAQKYKSSYDKSIKGPQLKVNDVVLVKIVAHKSRHKIQDKWEPEEYVVVEQPIASTPVYKVQTVTGDNIRTLHWNLLLPLGVKLEPEYKSDDSILDEDSDSDNSIVETDSKTKIIGKREIQEEKSSKDQCHDEIEERKPQSKEEKHVEFESQIELFPESEPSSDSLLKEDNVEKEAVSMYTDTPPSMEESSDEVIPEDVSPPSQFLLPNLDNSSDNEDTKLTELITEAENDNILPEEKMPSVNSEATSLVNTNEFLEFMDTIDMGESEKTNQSKIVETLDQSGVLEELTSVDPKSESQFSSFMSLKDPSTVEQELSKSSEMECTVKNDSGVNDQSDITSHDNDMIACDAKESSSPSIEISSSDTAASQIGEKADSSESETEPESAIQVEVVEPRRSGRNRKQTKHFGNPLLYRIAPRFIPEILQQMSETLESLQEKYSGTVEF